MKKKIVTLMMALTMTAALAAGCAGNTADSNNAEDAELVSIEEDEAEDETEPADDSDETGGTEENADAAAEEADESGEEEDEENYETGDASLDNTRNEDGIGEKELLVVSFGTSYNDSRRATIGAIEQKLEDDFGSEYSIRRGFTSQIIIDHVKKRDNVTIDNLEEALNRAADNGVKTLIIQPTHLMSGFEYNDLVEAAASYADSFETVSVGKPILTSDEDFDRVMKAITEETAAYDDGQTAICFMGHGTEAESNGVYAKMDQLLKDNGYANYFVGTVEATPSVDDVLAKVKEGDYKKVVLEPLMIVAGDHANNDMAGDDDDSWKSVFEAAGYEVECVVRGLGEMPAIREIIADHAKEAMKEAQ